MRGADGRRAGGGVNRAPTIKSVEELYIAFILFCLCFCFIVFEFSPMNERRELEVESVCRKEPVEVVRASDEGASWAPSLGVFLGTSNW